MQRDLPSGSPTPHPGHMIVAEYLVPLDLDPGDFARWCGIDAGRFDRLARAEGSFTVAEATRVARALDLNADRIIQMQTRHDLAAARSDAALAAVTLLPMPSAAPPFPEHDVLHGALAETSDVAYDGYCWFFREDVPGGRGYDGLHALWRGDRLRVSDPDGRPIYHGTVLKDLDGRMLLPYVAFQTWSAWFFNRYPADLAIGDEHRLFLEQLAANEA